MSSLFCFSVATVLFNPFVALSSRRWSVCSPLSSLLDASVACRHKREITLVFSPYDACSRSPPAHWRVGLRSLLALLQLVLLALELQMRAQQQHEPYVRTYDRQEMSMHGLTTFLTRVSTCVLELTQFCGWYGGLITTSPITRMFLPSHSHGMLIPTERAVGI